MSLKVFLSCIGIRSGLLRKIRLYTLLTYNCCLETVISNVIQMQYLLFDKILCSHAYLQLWNGYVWHLKEENFIPTHIQNQSIFLVTQNTILQRFVSLITRVISVWAVFREYFLPCCWWKMERWKTTEGKDSALSFSCPDVLYWHDQKDRTSLVLWAKTKDLTILNVGFYPKVTVKKYFLSTSTIQMKVAPHPRWNCSDFITTLPMCLG